MPSHAHPHAKLQRPSWWTPEAVLDCLQRGETTTELCQRASRETEGRVSVRTLRVDISQWAGSLSWGEQFTAALALFKHGRPGDGLVVNDEWFGEFYDELRKADGVVATACEAFGVGADLVEALRDPKSKRYNEDFADEVRLLEGARYARIRETVLNKAEKGDAKIGQKVLEARMPHLHAPVSRQEHSGRVEHDHQFTLSPEVLAASHSRVRTLMAGREQRVRELESGEQRIIELPKSQVKQTA